MGNLTLNYIPVKSLQILFQPKSDTEEVEINYYKARHGRDLSTEAKKNINNSKKVSA